MSTLGIMKERIASELRRDDLSSASEFRVLSAVSDIHDAIHTAIGEYQKEHLYFKQSRGDVVFDTVANQPRYTSSDETNISRIIKIEYGFIEIGGMTFKLLPRRNDLMDVDVSGDNPHTSDPQFYSWYAETIILEPIPSTAGYECRFGCILKTTAPATDNEASNRWMIDGELLVRSRAKAELYRHVIKDYQKADQYQMAANDALATLREITENMIQPEVALVEVWDPYG
jgi:hypothetical protein